MPIILNSPNPLLFPIFISIVRSRLHFLTHLLTPYPPLYQSPKIALFKLIHELLTLPFLFISLQHAQFHFCPYLEFAPLQVSNTDSVFLLLSSLSFVIFLINGPFSFYLRNGGGPQGSTLGPYPNGHSPWTTPSKPTA